MKYTISEMAKLLGVTTHMLRHYEKIGIIQPETNEQTGYRYYSVIDTRRFNLSRHLFSCGISLEKCMEILSNMPDDERNDIFDRTIEEQKRQIEISRLAIKILNLHKETYNHLTESIGNIQVKNYRPMWRLNFSDKENPVEDPELEKEKEAWLACMPGVFWVSCIRNEELKKFGSGVINYDYGLMIDEEDARKLGLNKSRHVEEIPGGDYLVSMHRKENRGPFLWDDVQVLTDYLKTNDVRLFGNAYSHIVASRREDGKEVNYHQILLKIYT